MEDIKNLLLSVLCVLSMIGCSKTTTQKEVFKLDNSTSELVKKSKQCSQIFNEKLGFQNNDKEGYFFIDDFVNAIENSNKELNYKRVLLIRIIESGETVTNTTITIRIFNDGSALISNHKSGVDLIEQTYLNFDIDEFYEEIKLAQENKKGTNTKVLIIDFESKNSCTCKIFENIKSLKTYELKKFNFFKND